MELSIVDATADENHGTIDFTVWQRGRTGREITVDYETSDGTAVSGEDYRSATGTLTYGPLQRSATISIELLNDDVQEVYEQTFSVTLSNEVNAPIKRGTATGTIYDDEERPQITIEGSEASEGGLLDYVVTLSRSEPNQVIVTMDYFTATSHNIFSTSEALPWASPETDFEIQRGSLTFNPGDETSRTIRVQTLDDDLDEPVEAVVFVLENFWGNAVNKRRDGTIICPWRFCYSHQCGDCGTILDDDVIELSISDAAAAEDASHLEFVVQLGEQTSVPVEVSYSTSDVTASAGQDYEAASGSLTLQPGTVRRTIRVALVDDDIAETSETFDVTLADAEGATLTDAVGTGTIADDEEPAFSVAGGAGVEGAAATFHVTLVGTGGDSAAVDYATSDGTAVAGEDYGAVSGRLTFSGGATTRTVSVPLVDDGKDEPAETFFLTLSSPVGGTIRTATAQATIDDNDEPPRVSIGDARGTEGETLAFPVTLDAASGREVSVAYRTSDGTAFGDEDYEPTEGLLTFSPGESSRTLRVTLLDDADHEPEEHFGLELSSPSNAAFAVRSATGSIVDDDPADKAPTKGLVLVFEPASNPDRQGFVRVINHSAESGEVLVEAIDDAGLRLGPVRLSIGAGEARHFNSDDLEVGNSEKGIPRGVGPPGTGIWRLELSSELDIEVLSYARTSDGFVTSLHDTSPATAGVHRAVFLNPGENVDQVSRLRLINPGTAEALVTVTGTDDRGTTSAEVVLTVPAGTAREWTAAELESGTDARGALGDGDGKWRLRLSSDRPVVALSLIESPTGNLTNLSTLTRTPGRTEGDHAVPLFPSASDPEGRQGFVRVANRSGEAADVLVEAFDGTVVDYESLALVVGADEVASFNSDDLEQGNSDKGLTGSTGAGVGDWWLELSSGAEINVGSYIRTTDGFLTAMHDLVPESEGAYRVVFFNPAENVNQVSVLWLVNRGDVDAEVTIEGVDDAGVVPGSGVLTAVPAGSSRRLSSAELESGEAEAIESGSLGDGHGKWRLRVVSDQPLMVMSLLENPTGHLTNLSTAPGRGDDPEQASAMPSSKHLE